MTLVYENKQLKTKVETLETKLTMRQKRDFKFNKKPVKGDNKWKVCKFLMIIDLGK